MIVFPLKTEADDGKIRLGVLFLILICFLVYAGMLFDSWEFSDKLSKELAMQESEAFFSNYEALTDAENTKSFVNNYLGELNDDLERDKRNRMILTNSWMYRFAFVPERFDFLNLISYQFVHSGWMHLLFNMWFLYLCGVAMERIWGIWKFLGLYLLCGLIAALVFTGMEYVINQSWSDVPLVGASGAVSGIMGAFLVTHHQYKVQIAYWAVLRIKTAWIPSYIYFTFWFMSELFFAITTLGGTPGVAYFAHVGGFVTGLILGKVVRNDYELEKSIRFGDVGTGKTSSKARAEPRGETVSGTAMIHLAWNKLQEGKLEEAKEMVIKGFNFLCAHSSSHKAEIRSNADKIVLHFSRLGIEGKLMFRWAMNLAEINEYERALAFYDKCMMVNEDKFITQSCLFNTSKLMLEQGQDKQLIRAKMDRLMSTSPQGMLLNKSQKLLERLG